MLRVVLQRAKNDCGVASLATLLGFSYEEALELTAAANGVRKKGLYYTSLERAAALKGKTLTRRRRYDPEEAVGILGVENDFIAHFVVLYEGHIFDPEDGTIWPYEDYLRHYNYRAMTLLVTSPAAQP